MDTIEISFDSICCLVCSRQITSRIHQPHPSLIGNHSDDQDDLACSAHDNTGAILPRAGRLVHGAMPKAAIQLSSAKVVSSDTTCHTIRTPDTARSPFSRTIVVDETPSPLYCSDRCRFADHQSYHCAIDIEYNLNRTTSSCAPPDPANSFPDIPGSQDDGYCLSDAPSESSASSPVSDCAVNAYSRLCAIYGFAPLPPPPPFSPRVATSTKDLTPCLEGGIIMAARRIQAALFPEKYTKSFWGLPAHGDSEDDNKPIPGWTDGSNAWRPSVYGLAPPRDFTRPDPNDAAIRAYGSCVATPHRSRGVHSTLNKDRPALEVQITSSCPPSSPVDAPTQELYRQFCASFTRRSRSRTLTHIRGGNLSGSTRCSPRKIPLLKPGAEGCLLVPDVKMRIVNSTFPRVDGSAGKSNSVVVAGEHRTSRQHNSDPGPAANRTQSYQSETVTYPIMRSTPKKEKCIERKVINGVERDVEVEVLLEEPIKRLFLFGGARD